MTLDDGQSFDVIMVGGGPGALAGSLLTQEAGLKTLILEATDYIGGTTALSGGVIWIPNNPLMQRDHINDSTGMAMDYIRAAVGDDGGPAATSQRQEAYVRGGCRMIEDLLQRGFRFIRADWPDYYPELPGGHASPGRLLAAPMYDARKLGEAGNWVRPRTPLPFGMMPDSVSDLFGIILMRRDAKAAWAACKLMGKSMVSRLRGVDPLLLGTAHVGQLLEASLEAGTRIERQVKVTDLVLDNGRVTGVEIEQAGKRLKLSATRGVLLNSGGITHNRELREKFGPHPASTDWTATSPNDTGIVTQAAIDNGAATANLDQYIWMIMAMNPDGKMYGGGARPGAIMINTERQLPFSIIVDSAGKRYFNEACSYMDIGQIMYEHNKTTPCIPSWLIIEKRHRQYYPFGTASPGITPRDWIKSGFMKQASTISELAKQCGIDGAGLQDTIVRFNKFAAEGVDEDFGRGQSAYDRIGSDPKVKPDPNLGPIERSPFYAVPIVPSDVGSAGGLLTDEHARVIDSDGEIIPGLYACGTTAASAFGRKYIGGGVSVGQSTVFGYLAAQHIVSSD